MQADAEKMKQELRTYLDRAFDAIVKADSLGFQGVASAVVYFKDEEGVFLVGLKKLGFVVQTQGMRGCYKATFASADYREAHIESEDEEIPPEGS